MVPGYIRVAKSEREKERDCHSSRGTVAAEVWVLFASVRVGCVMRRGSTISSSKEPIQLRLMEDKMRVDV